MEIYLFWWYRKSEQKYCEHYTFKHKMIQEYLAANNKSLFIKLRVFILRVFIFLYTSTLTRLILLPYSLNMYGWGFIT